MGDNNPETQHFIRTWLTQPLVPRQLTVNDTGIPGTLILTQPVLWLLPLKDIVILLPMGWMLKYRYMRITKMFFPAFHVYIVTCIYVHICMYVYEDFFFSLTSLANFWVPKATRWSACRRKLSPKWPCSAGGPCETNNRCCICRVRKVILWFSTLFASAEDVVPGQVTPTDALFLGDPPSPPPP